MENTKPTEEAGTTATSLRIPGPLFERVEAERRRRGAQVGVDLPRTSLINALLAERLDEIEGTLETARG